MDPLELVNAIKDNNIELANEILNSEDIEDIINERNNSHKTALYYAVTNKQYDLIEKILNVPTVDPDLGAEDGNPPIIQAWILDDARSYKMLIDAGADPNNLLVNYYSVLDEPIPSAVTDNNPNILTYYLEDNPHLVDMNEVLEDDTLLGLAVKENSSIEIGQILIDYGSDVNAVTEDHLVLLSMVDNIEWAKLLIENGANVNYRETAGLTPIDHHIGLSSYELIIYLIEKGADPWMQDDNGDTPIDSHFSSISLGVLEYIFRNCGIGKQINFPDNLITYINENMTFNQYDNILDRIKLCFYYGITFDYTAFTNVQFRRKSEDLIDSLRFSLVELSRRSMIINKIDTNNIPSLLLE